MKLKELVKSHEVLKKLANQEMPIRVSFKIGVFLKEAEKYLQSYEEERMKLFEMYGEEKSEGELVVPEEHRSDFLQKMSELGEESIDIKCPELDLDNLVDVKLSPQDIVLIDFLFEGDKE